jgi:hypothetical protein
MSHDTNNGEGVIPLPPGIISLPTGFLGRYREFDFCLSAVKRPIGTIEDWRVGNIAAQNLNASVRRTLKEGFEWMWIIDDDSIFPPTILEQLWAHDVDVVSPFVLSRVAPFLPNVRKSSDERYQYVQLEEFAGRTGLFELSLNGWAVGSAGMFIRRRVLEKLRDPWFEYGKIRSDATSYDLWFCKKVCEAGFNLYVDLDCPMGHITHVPVYPLCENGKYRAAFRIPEKGNIFG